jgi:UDP-N-acetylmuramoyl-L-alanyl-D-glutamate--2,6-diaminopimelate ligase
MTPTSGTARSASLGWLMDGIADIPQTDVRVDEMTLDSRRVAPGSLFFAVPGSRNHGLEFADAARRAGAVAVLWGPAPGLDPPRSLPGNYAAPVPGLSKLVGRIADRFFGWPSSQLQIAGITGTNGKTTCAYLLAQALDRLGMPAAYIGTLGAGRVGDLEAGTHTTPDAVSVHRELGALKARGVRAVAMEVSSHALAQSRVEAVRFFGAAFTNLTRDHLDYHGSMTAYGEAKARLFAVAGLQQAVIHVGDPFGRELADRLASRLPITAVWIGDSSIGWFGQRTLRASVVQSSSAGLTLALEGSFGPATLRSTLIGRFNAENLLVVLAMLLAMDFPLAQAVASLEGAAAAPGRMEALRGGADQPLVVIDYAHTPDALANALEALREHTAGRIWCVFGCGGDRDEGKRPLMGAVAAAAADVLIVTDDNPRSEDPAAIAADIVAGIDDASGVRVIHDRARAIATAISEAGAGDVVLVAGKGHEDYQIYASARRGFSDRAEALKHLRTGGA